MNWFTVISVKKRKRSMTRYHRIGAEENDIERQLGKEGNTVLKK